MMVHLPLRLLGRSGEFARELHYSVSADSGEFLLPRRRVGDLLVVVARRVVAREAARHAILRHQEIQTRGHRDAAFDWFRCSGPERRAGRSVRRRNR